jgi:hypothetical protein
MHKLLKNSEHSEEDYERGASNFLSESGVPELNDGSCVRRRPEYRNHVRAYDFVHERTRWLIRSAEAERSKDYALYGT